MNGFWKLQERSLSLHFKRPPHPIRRHIVQTDHHVCFQSRGHKNGIMNATNKIRYAQVAYEMKTE